MAKRVTVRLGWSFGYTDPEDHSFAYYGPGEVSVPIGLAQALGLPPVESTQDEQPRVAPTPVITEPVLLSEDFPHLDVLQASGIRTYEAVPTTEEALVALSGIGKKRATEIMTALVEAGYGAD